MAVVIRGKGRSSGGIGRSNGRAHKKAAGALSAGSRASKSAASSYGNSPVGGSTPF